MAVEKPQYGALTGADVDTVGGRILMLEAHAVKLALALDGANAQIAERDATIVKLTRELRSARRALAAPAKPPSLDTVIDTALSELPIPGRVPITRTERRPIGYVSPYGDTGD